MLSSIVSESIFVLLEMEENMIKTESDVSLLNETHINSRMAISAIETVLPKVYDEDLSYDLNLQRKKYRQIEHKAKQKLDELGEMPITEGIVNRAVLWSSIQMNTIMNNSTSHIAQLMINESSKGITDMMKTIKRQKNVGKFSSEIADELIDFEDKNIERLKNYLE